MYFTSPQHLKTPTKSPTGSRFTSLPNLDDDTMGSPSAMFLSPNTPTRLERKTKEKGASESATPAAAPAAAVRAPLTPRTTPKRDLERDRLLTTPTDFAFDYGKHPTSAYSLDNSNVLAWLHSPTANGLFSPGGGLGSMMNTPKGGGPRTPRTPTVHSTSFFFSDVAGLPRGAESASPKPGADGGKRSARGSNSMICISPLSSHKAKHGVQGALSPKINMEMFASPAERSGMASLGMKPGAASGVQQGGNLDAVNLAERDLMEDEDLSRLLQLANNTPRPAPSDRPVAAAGSSDTNVFRAQESQKDGENLPALSLPVIGGKGKEGSGTKLSRKTSSEASRPVIPAGGGQPTSTPSPDKQGSISKTPSSVGSSQPDSHPYMTSYHHHEAAYYPSLHPGMSHGGSMRVVVGGPPRPKSGTPPNGALRYTMGRPGEYPPHYATHYPPHHGVPPHHMHPHYSHYPPPSHPGGPRHVPLYSAEDKPKPGVKKQSPKGAAKAGVKRSSPGPSNKPPPSAKKTKKSPQTGAKKKNRSPQLVDKADRQKAAAAIQAVNQASGGKNDKAASLAAAILRGVTMRPSGKWQAQLYFAGKSVSRLAGGHSLFIGWESF